MKILEEKTIHDGFLKIIEAQVEENGNQFVRCKLTRPSVVAVLLYNEDTEKFILVQQFRYPIGDYTLEAVAGYIDDKETPNEAARRETLEETGYNIDRMEFVKKFYLSPGISDELVYGFIGIVKNTSKVTQGGGLETENESIVLRELTRKELITAISLGNIVDIDAKTVILAQTILLNSITNSK